MTLWRLFVSAVYSGFAFFGVMLVVVFMTGSTFGQRCAEIHQQDSVEWQQCVETFSTGR